MQLKNRIVVVTGAAGGIGSAVVKELLSAGVQKVIACDLNVEHLKALVAFDALRIEARQLNVTDEKAVGRLAAECGLTNILINCHGIVVHEAYVEPATLDRFRKEMDVNYWGQVHMCRAFARVVQENPPGAIVNFLSPLAYVTFPFLGPYCASKAACRVLTEAMRAELSPAGTLVMAVFPGSIDTQMMTHLNIPKSSPQVVAEALILGLRADDTEVWAGEGAEDMRQRLRSDPAAFAAEAATQLRLAKFNAPA